VQVQGVEHLSPRPCVNQIAGDGWELVLCANTAGLFVFKR
jgi:hypothetical protein